MNIITALATNLIHIHISTYNVLILQQPIQFHTNESPILFHYHVVAIRQALKPATVIGSLENILARCVVLPCNTDGRTKPL